MIPRLTSVHRGGPVTRGVEGRLVEGLPPTTQPAVASAATTTIAALTHAYGHRHDDDRDREHRGDDQPACKVGSEW